MGLSTLIVGFDYDRGARLYSTYPSGTYHEWETNAIDRQAKPLREYLDKSYTETIYESKNVEKCMTEIEAEEKKHAKQIRRGATEVVDLYKR